MCIRVCKLTEEYDVDICRPSKWGNPYSHLSFSTALYKVDTVEEAVEKFEEYLIKNKDLMESLHELKRKRLGCVCKKSSICHGDIIVKYVNKLEYKDEMKNLFE
jgi:hypothetical protein